MWGKIAGLAFKFLGGNLVKSGVGIAGEFLKRKQKRELNKDELDAKYDLRAMKAGEGSLKDEYLTFITTSPILQMAIGSFAYAIANWHDPEAWFRASAMFIDNLNNISGTYAGLLGAVYTFVFGKGAVGVYQRHQVKKGAIAQKQNGQPEPEPKNKMTDFFDDGGRK